jgi:hypothetical protein
MIFRPSDRDLVQPLENRAEVGPAVSRAVVGPVQPALRSDQGWTSCKPRRYWAGPTSAVFLQFSRTCVCVMRDARIRARNMRYRLDRLDHAISINALRWSNLVLGWTKVGPFRLGRTKVDNRYALDSGERLL